MNPETLTALKGSIEKWEKIVDGSGGDHGNANCRLCDIFYRNKCGGCIVSENVGDKHCSSTPYTKWYEHHEEEAHSEYFPYIVKCPTCEGLAKEELEFLKSLLPKPARQGMDEEDLIALRESIILWEGYARGKPYKICPLCELGRKRNIEEGQCSICIIKKYTGKISCDGTPYWKDRYLGYPEYQQNMVNYLKSFLPQKGGVDTKQKEVVKMKFVIKDDVREDKDIEVKLSLQKNTYYGDVEVVSDGVVLIAFKDGKVRRVGGATKKGIFIDSRGRILEYE